MSRLVRRYTHNYHTLSKSAHIKTVAVVVAQFLWIIPVTVNKKMLQVQTIEIEFLNTGKPANRDMKMQY